MIGLHLIKGSYSYSYKDQFGRQHLISLGVKSYELAAKIASKFLGEPLKRTRSR